MKMSITPPREFIKKFLKRFDKTDLYILLTVYIVGIITNFYFFISNGLAADALKPTYFTNAWSWEATLGRPLLIIVDRLRFGLTNQFLIVVICLFWISCAMMVARRIFKIKNLFLLLLLSALVCVSPQFTETYEYLYCADAYLFAFFLSFLAVYYMSKISAIKKDKKSFISSVACIVVACGLYQAYLGVIMGLIVALGIKETLETNSKTALKHFLRNMLVTLFSVCVYYVALRVLLKICHLKLSGYKGANNLGMSTILAIPQNIANCFVDFFNFFFADERIIFNSAYGRSIIYGIIALLSIIVFVLVVKNQKEEKTKKSLLVILLLLVLPIAQNIMNVIASGTRINLVTGVGLITTIFVPVVFLTELKEDNFASLLEWGCGLSLIVLTTTFIFGDIFTYIYREQQYNATKTVLSSVYERATILNGYDENMKYIFSYNLNPSLPDRDRTNGMVTGTDLTWRNYAGSRRYGYILQKALGKEVETAEEKDYAKIINTKEFKNMPVYPKAGSVKIINNTIVAKFSDKTYKVKDEYK